MMQASNGSWVRRTQPMRHTRREARWALQDENADKHGHSQLRLPVVGGSRADVTLLRVGASQMSITHLACKQGGREA